MERLRAPLILVARLLLACIFVVEGWGKIVNYAGTAQYMQTYGIPPQLLPAVILTELGGGLLVASGWLTRWAALALAGFCLLTAVFFHTDFSDADQLIHFNKDLAIAGGFLVLVACGAGDWSLDAVRAGARSRRHAARHATT
ncbi:MAG: DoxX family protein [Methylobacteriaceae bacterium]|nr:DoxX family protein [Methylobacteriaceae bacterium]